MKLSYFPRSSYHFWKWNFHWSFGNTFKKFLPYVVFDKIDIINISITLWYILQLNQGIDNLLWFPAKMIKFFTWVYPSLILFCLNIFEKASNSSRFADSSGGKSNRFGRRAVWCNFVHPSGCAPAAEPPPGPPPPDGDATGGNGKAADGEVGKGWWGGRWAGEKGRWGGWWDGWCAWRRSFEPWKRICVTAWPVDTVKFTF